MLLLLTLLSSFVMVKLYNDERRWGLQFVVKIFHHNGSNPVEDINRHRLVASVTFRLANLMRQQFLSLPVNDASAP